MNYINKKSRLCYKIMENRYIIWNIKNKNNNLNYIY